MKKCTQCGQLLSEDAKFCFKCGGNSFEQAVEGGSYQQDANQQTPYQQDANQQASYQQPYQQQASYQQPSYQQQPAYQQPYSQQPGFQPQPADKDSEPATIGNFLIFNLLMLIPIFNIIYLIIVAVGGPKYKKTMTNYARASLIWLGIAVVLYIIVFAAVGASFAHLITNNYPSYSY